MNSEVTLLLETVHFAADKHRNQRRKDADGTPYINHPIGKDESLYYDAFHATRKSVNPTQRQVKLVGK